MAPTRKPKVMNKVKGKKAKVVKKLAPINIIMLIYSVSDDGEKLTTLFAGCMIHDSNCVIIGYVNVSRVGKT